MPALTSKSIKHRGYMQFAPKFKKALNFIRTHMPCRSIDPKTGKSRLWERSQQQIVKDIMGTNEYREYLPGIRKLQQLFNRQKAFEEGKIGTAPTLGLDFVLSFCDFYGIDPMYFSPCVPLSEDLQNFRMNGLDYVFTRYELSRDGLYHFLDLVTAFYRDLEQYTDLFLQLDSRNRTAVITLTEAGQLNGTQIFFKLADDGRIMLTHHAQNNLPTKLVYEEVRLDILQNILSIFAHNAHVRKNPGVFTAKWSDEKDLKKERKNKPNGNNTTKSG